MAEDPAVTSNVPELDWKLLHAQHAVQAIRLDDTRQIGWYCDTCDDLYIFADRP